MIPGAWPVSDDIDDRTASVESALLAAFPARLAEDVRTVARALPPAYRPPYTHCDIVRVDRERLTIPHRLPLPEPSDDAVRGLSATQARILHCLYSRHDDGYVRQRHLRRILPATDPWVVPYVVELVGEYVVDIVIDIRRGLTDVVTVRTAQHEVYGRFAATDSAFLHVIGQRVTSYWHRYYRNRYPRRYYPGRVILDELDEAADAYRAALDEAIRCYRSRPRARVGG
ncbi:hypothetical protein [Nocardia pseudobrasiliensis]|uniref:Uncharacterized protein n=1 Tax=Nocardia pseudobrasiliensis TaxID=45979 RepID=A0A370I100_9NOCA|nr:hypothetical protein [Nocardia pseudobrasiliensis]RDI64422.1 hypothetical protein DFR76_108255 [Nocardia pseudobrasiliensis]